MYRAGIGPLLLNRPFRLKPNRFFVNYRSLPGNRRFFPAGLFLAKRRHPYPGRLCFFRESGILGKYEKIIFLYGPPGTGKTEFARSLIHAAGKVLRQFRLDPEGPFSHRRGTHRVALRAALAGLEKDQVLLVDEADSLLASRGFFLQPGEGEKRRLNLFLDDSNKKIIWIANDIDRIHESTRRRFDYSLGFHEMDAGQREKAWLV